MKKYAKLICAVLVLALALGLGACGKPAEPKNLSCSVCTYSFFDFAIKSSEMFDLPFFGMT